MPALLGEPRLLAEIEDSGVLEPHDIVRDIVYLPTGRLLLQVAHLCGLQPRLLEPQVLLHQRRHQGVIELRAVGEDQPALQPPIVHLMAALIDEGHQIVEAVPQLHRVVDLPRERLQEEPLHEGFDRGLARVVVVRRGGSHGVGAVAVLHPENLLGRVGEGRQAIEELPGVFEHVALREGREIMVGGQTSLRQRAHPCFFHTVSETHQYFFAVLASVLSFFLFNFFLTKIIVAGLLLADFIEAVHFRAVLSPDLVEELGNFELLVLLEEIGVLGLEVEVDPGVGREYLVAEAGIDARQGVAQRRNAALARTHPKLIIIIQLPPTQPKTTPHPPPSPSPTPPPTYYTSPRRDGLINFMKGEEKLSNKEEQ